MQQRTGVIQRTLVAAGLVGALSLVVFAQNAGVRSTGKTAGPGVAIKVNGSVEQALDRLKKMVADNGMMVMGELHQGKILAMTGLKTQSETIFVGNPNVGKKLFSQEPGAGVIVPIRINIYADARGHTVVRYVPPSQLLGEFGNAEVNKVASMLDGKLQKMMTMLAQ